MAVLDKIAHFNLFNPIQRFLQQVHVLCKQFSEIRSPHVTVVISAPPIRQAPFAVPCLFEIVHRNNPSGIDSHALDDARIYPFRNIDNDLRLDIKIIGAGRVLVFRPDENPVSDTLRDFRRHSVRHIIDVLPVLALSAVRGEDHQFRVRHRSTIHHAIGDHYGYGSEPVFAIHGRKQQCFVFLISDACKEIPAVRSDIIHACQVVTGDVIIRDTPEIMMYRCIKIGLEARSIFFRFAYIRRFRHIESDIFVTVKDVI